MTISSADLTAIAEAVWTTDGIIPNPEGAKSNPFWQGQRIMADLGAQVRAIEAAVAALAATPPPPPSVTIGGVLALLDPAQVADAIVTSLGPEVSQEVVTALQALLAAPPPAA